MPPPGVGELLTRWPERGGARYGPRERSGCHPGTVRPNPRRGSRMTDANEDRAPATIRRDRLEVASSTSRTSEVTKTVNGGARTLLAACGPASRARIGSAYAMVSFVIERPTDAFGWTCADLTLLTYRLKVHKVH